MTSSVLKALYASGGTEIRIPTLSFRCAGWLVDYHICQGYEDMTATLEDSTTVTFTPTDFAAQLAKRGAEGNQNLQFAIGATDETIALMDQAVESGEPSYIDYREFLLSDLSAPARPVETMAILNYSYEGDTLSFTAAFHDSTNQAWPRRRYTTQFAPGLKYHGS